MHPTPWHLGADPGTYTGLQWVERPGAVAALAIDPARTPGLTLALHFTGNDRPGAVRWFWQFGSHTTPMPVRPGLA